MSSTEVVWENTEAYHYDDEKDAFYFVRVHPGEHRMEWNILCSKGTKDLAIEVAMEYSKEHPGVPVRVERQVP